MLSGFTIFCLTLRISSEVQTDIMPGILQKLSDELHIDFEVAEFETTWPESIPWDDILRGSNISHVSYCLLSFFTSRITNSRYFFNSLPSNSIGSSSVCRHKMFFFIRNLRYGLLQFNFHVCSSYLAQQF